MARKITRCVEKRTVLVKRTRDTLVEYYHMFSKWSPFTDCCVQNVKHLKYNEKFKAFVSIQPHRVFANVSNISYHFFDAFNIIICCPIVFEHLSWPVVQETASHFRLTYSEWVGPVPARYVRQSQMCPQLDMSDKNDQKRQDMSDKARCVRQKLPKIARYVRQMCQTKMKTKCKICLTGHNYNFQALRRAFKPTYSNYTSILFNT